MHREFPGFDDGRGRQRVGGGDIDSAPELVGLAAIGKIKITAGPVTIFRANAILDCARPADGDFIFEGDVIETGADGLVGIVFIDGTTFHLYANSRIVIDQFSFGGDVSSCSARLRAFKGKFGLMAGKIAAAGRFAIDTPLSKIQSVVPSTGVASLGFMFLLCLIEDVRASSESETLWLVDGGTITYKDFEHGVFELVTKDGQHIIVDDPGQMIVLHPTGSGVGIDHIPNDRAEIVALQDVYQRAYATFVQGLQDPFLQQLIKTSSDIGSSTLFNNGYNPFSTTQASLNSQTYTPPPGSGSTPSTVVLPPVVPGGVTIGATFTETLPVSNAQTAPVYLGPSNASHPNNFFLNLTLPNNEVLTTVVISGLPSGETITSGTGKIYSGGGPITILGTDFYSGLTLSNFAGTAAVLTIAATVFGAGGARLTVTTLALTIDAPIVGQPEAVHWIGPSGGNWDTAANWSTGVVPIPHQDVFLDKVGTVVSSGTVNISSLAVSAGVTLTITGGSFAIPTSATGKPLSNAGVISIGTGATMTVGDAAVAGAVVNIDTLQLSGGTLNFVNVAVDNTGATLQVDTASVLNLNTSSIAGGTLTNNGSVVSNGVGSLTGVAATNGNLLEVATGTLTIYNGSVANTGGTFKIDGGAAVELNGTTITDGTITDDGAIHVTGSSTIDGGASLNNGVVNVDDGVTLTLDNITITGTVIMPSASTIAATGTFTVPVNASALGDDHTLTLTGTAAFTVSNLIGNLEASAVNGGLNVTTGSVAGLSIATGNGANIIDASALTNNQVLTLTGNDAATVTLTAGDLTATADSGALTVIVADDGLASSNTIATGSNAISITDAATVTADAIAVDAAALADDTLLTLTGSSLAAFTVSNLIGNLEASAVNGGLNVTTGSVAGLSIATGNGANIIDASALTDNQVLTLTGNAAAAVFLNAGDLTAGAYTGNITVTGGTGSNTITTGSGDDTVTLAGAETAGTIDLGTGTDSLTLANGTNTLTVSHTETIAGGSGDDTVTLGTTQTSGSVNLGSGTNTLNLAAGANTLSISNVASVHGTGSDDTLTLSATFSGGTIDLGAGNGDTLNLFAGSTNSMALAGVEFVNGGASNSDESLTLTTTVSGVAIDLKGGNDTLYLAAGANTLSISNVESVHGTGSADTLELTSAFTGGTIDLSGGTDVLILAAGNNTLTADNIETINATALTTGQTLTLDGSGAANVSLGDGVNLDAGGYTGNLTITTGTGANTITTGSGNDTITGGAGNDTIDGGTGTDTAVYASTLTAANITYDNTTDPLHPQWVVNASAGGEGTDQVVNVEQIATGGHHILLVGAGSDYTTIQSAIDAAASGDTIMIADGNYNENLTLNGKYLTLQGIDDSGANATTLHGQITASGTLDGALTIRNMAIDATGHQYGLFVSANSTAFAGSIVLDNTTISDAQTTGFAYIRAGNGSTPTLTDTVGAITITNSEFFGNATVSSPAGGRGDILLFGYNQDLTISDVSIHNAGAFAQKAIQLRGLQDGGDTANVGPYDAAGHVSITNLTVSGTYLQDLLAFYNIASFASFTTTGVSITAAAPWGLINFDGVGGTVDLSSGFSGTNSAGPVAVEQGLSSADAFTGTSGDDVFVGRDGADTIHAGAGNDTIIGFSGADTVDGGADTDTIVLTATSTDLNNALDTQILNVEAVSAATATAGVTIDLHSQNEGFVITGSAHDDIITGAGADTITGGAGNDTIDGGTGTDTAVYASTLTAANITYDNTTDPLHPQWVVNASAGGEGTDHLVNVEQIATGGHHILLVGAGSDYITIQSAIDAAASGDTIMIADGAYHENTTIATAGLTIAAAGANAVIEGSFKTDNGVADGGVAAFLQTAASYTGISGVGVTIAADNVTIQGLKIDGFTNAMKFADGATTDATTLSNLTVTDSVVGLEKGTTANVTNLTMTGGSISDGYIGIDFAKSTTVGEQSVGIADHIVIDGTSFTNLDAKGIYAEALSNAHLTNIVMNNVGQYGAGTAFGTQGSGGNGIDINLKNGSYSNIEIDHFTLTNVGASDRNGTDAIGHKNGGAIVVEARDAGSYSTVPASLTDAVSIHDGTIDGHTSTGIQVGEPGQANLDGPPVTIDNVAITGAEHNGGLAPHGDITNVTAATTSYTADGNDNTIDASQSTGTVTIDGGAGNDTITAGHGNDTITGGAGNDGFVFTNLANSLAANFDTITDFTSGTDHFTLGHAVTLAGAALDIEQFGANGTGNLAADIAAVLNSASHLVANGAAQVTITGGTDAGSYAVLGDAVAGFNAATDGVVKLANAATLHVSDFA